MARTIRRAAVDTGGATETSATRGAPGAPRREAGPGEPEDFDGYSDRLMKLIPAEVVTLYLAMDAAIFSAGDNTVPVTLIVLAIGCVATWFHLRFVARVDFTPQIVVSVLAFAVWAVNIGHGFDAIPGYQASYAALLLLTFTFFVPELPFLKRAPASR